MSIQFSGYNNTSTNYFSSDKNGSNNPPPSLSQPQPIPGLIKPDLLTRQVAGGTIPTTPLFNSGTQDISTKASELRNLLEHADEQTLARYQMGIVKSPQGQIIGFILNGRPVSNDEAQQHLAPVRANLAQDLKSTKQEVDSDYRDFATLANGLFNQLTNLEQGSVRIQMQAVNVLYVSFVGRIQQIDGLVE